MNKKEKQFVSYVKSECKKYGVKCDLRKTKYVKLSGNIKCSGYFDEEAPVARRLDFENETEDGLNQIPDYQKNYLKIEFVKHIHDTVTNDMDKNQIYSGSQALSDTQSILTDRTPYIKLSEKIAEYFPTAACAKKKGK